jgi:hypothetical protein
MAAARVEGGGRIVAAVREGFFDNAAWITGAGGRFLANIVAWAAKANSNTIRVAGFSSALVKADIINAYKAILVRDAAGVIAGLPPKHPWPLPLPLRRT